MNSTAAEEEQISYERLVEFFRKTIVEDYGYTEAATDESQNVLSNYVSPHMGGKYLVNQFLHSVVLREVQNKFRQVKVNLDKENNPIDEESKRLIEEFSGLFNPTLVYSFFDKYAKQPVISALERTVLETQEVKRIAGAAEKWLEVIRPIEKETQNGFWMFNLSNRIESLAALLDLRSVKSYLNEGTVVEFADKDSKVYSLAGLVVDGFTNHPVTADNFKIDRISLLGTWKKEKFAQYIGKRVRYHFVNIIRDDIGTPYGELIALPDQFS